MNEKEAGDYLYISCSSIFHRIYKKKPPNGGGIGPYFFRLRFR
jgi:hypothetical protein